MNMTAEMERLKNDTRPVWETNLEYRRKELRSEIEHVTSMAVSALSILGEVPRRLVVDLIEARDELAALGHIEKHLREKLAADGR